MPLRSLFMEKFPILSDYSSNSPPHPSLLRRSSSCHVVAEDRLYRAIDLTRPGNAAFPSPLSSERLTSYAPASKARDAFPFPLQPTEIATIKPLPDSSSDCSPRSRKRYLSFGSPYLTPPPSPDRYIPARCVEHDHVTNYHLGKSPEQLSSTEKLLRHKAATPDPFGARNLQRVTDGVRIPRGNSPRTFSPNRPRGVSDSLGLPSGVTSFSPRRASAGAVWNVGGPILAAASGPITGVPNGRGGMLGSGTNAPMFNSRFFERETSDQSLERFEGRVAAALDIDRTSRVLSISRFSDIPLNLASPTTGEKRKQTTRTSWKDGQWICESKTPLLDAPQLRDDFYCSVLAYCYTSRTLAVGLHNRVYLWSEESGVQHPRMEENRRNTYVTSLSFSSTQGGNSILAIGRNSGQISLWSLFDESDRFQSQQPNAVACLSFKPVPTRRQSERLDIIVSTEELLVGDEVGVVYYYSVEWGNSPGDARWYGAMHLMAKIDIHTQQICGLAWSPDGDYFATGGNDNICCLFEVKDILTPPASSFVHGPLRPLMAGLVPDFVPNAPSHRTLGSMLGNGRPHEDVLAGDTIRPIRFLYLPGRSGLMLHITEGRQRHKWLHSAAVKAIAFCPWQRGLIASGGGSNDRAIHFYHAYSGACLATISVQAQVTSLIWSTTRREIAATFGYAQPEHPYRIAVFSWPDCRQVVAIPWAGEMRALYAIPYPGGPNEASRQRTEGGRWWSRTAEEGCIVVASSDESVKFHEVWSEARKSTGGNTGLLGGSAILESLEGIDREGPEVIR